MSAFPYPVRDFACQSYSKKMWKRMRDFDGAFYHSLCVYGGSVAGETGILGLKIDFRAGLRLEVPKGHFHVRISDGETGKVYFDEDVSETLLVSVEKYYIPWHVEVEQDDGLVFAHDIDLDGQEIYVAVLSRSLGDMLAFLPSIVEFERVHQAHVTLCVPEGYEDVVRLCYPSFPLAQHVPDDAYAAFYLGNGNGDPHQTPVDGRTIPLEQIARVILGMDGAPPAPPAAIGERLRQEPRLMVEPYVCISVQGSSVLKSWLWPGGWDVVVAALKEAGYRVVCIDKEREQSDYGITVRCPAGAEDDTGDKPLTERAQLLAHAAFCVGLGSGLSWLAWTVGCPVVMIAGFSLPWYEFPEAYRVWNPRVCTGCFQDVEHSFLGAVCPRHGKKSPRFAECQRCISPQSVLRAIERLRSERQR